MKAGTYFVLFPVKLMSSPLMTFTQPPSEACQLSPGVLLFRALKCNSCLDMYHLSCMAASVVALQCRYLCTQQIAACRGLHRWIKAVQKQCFAIIFFVPVVEACLSLFFVISASLVAVLHISYFPELHLCDGCVK